MEGGTRSVGSRGGKEGDPLLRRKRSAHFSSFSAHHFSYPKSQEVPTTSTQKPRADLLLFRRRPSLLADDELPSIMGTVFASAGWAESLTRYERRRRWRGEEKGAEIAVSSDLERGGGGGGRD